MKLSDLKINSTHETNGAWVNVIGDVSVKVRGTSYLPYRRFLERAFRDEDRKHGPREGIPIDVRERIALDALIEHLLLDWSGVDGDDDKPIPYSQAKAREILGDPDNRPLRDAVSRAALEVGIAGQDDISAIAGN